MKATDTDGRYFPVFEFHMARKLRQEYQIEDSFFSVNGTIVFADFASVRSFVHKLNGRRDPRLHIYPGEVNAAGLIEEIYHIVFREYEQKVNPRVFARAEKYLLKNYSEEKLQELYHDFLDKFPASDIFKGRLSIPRYLAGKTQGRSNTYITLEEMIMLFFANFNPGNKKIKELFDDKYLTEPETFRRMIDELEDFFETQPGFGPGRQDLFSLFKTPILSAPDDLSKQLDYILEHWQPMLPENLITLLLKSKDLLKEDFQPEAHDENGPPTVVPRYKGEADNIAGISIGKSGYRFAKDSVQDYEDHEQFTPDVHWMPSVVLMAKNTYVWLDQLSKKYERDIKLLNQIPDEELDLLKKWNFTGLWLIGIWERSETSKQIKHIMGNIDAVSSAYSLFDYQIAADLGGDEAYNDLNERAKARGIRLASDMVPNHTGLYSKWMVEHPDYFIQAPAPPFPGYRFTGENLSQDPNLEIRIEDGYFTRTDAAVVFQRIDKRNNNTRYIYHGNDGTVMPWNDTAQLDMLKEEVREAVIGKIFEVARKFSIIRFDAAMTLAKKHFARLWYPHPGSGGDIPSRADYAMSQERFDALFPVEFWREVVDRMNAEMPETLLLAEAFWFMEGYFVRTLGMHRVYNSAFMHMLKNEENEKYRDLITNTLEFEPEILKRYVNFMSNPDEETAIRQFGSDDKYFGVCLMMNTLPGLPMFGHGQVEGYTEKYGMEYQRAYYNEVLNSWLVEKHEKEIFPLTKKRYLFSEVDNFNIFDFLDGYGNVNENVFAYTNRFRNEKTLVLFNNKYEQATGRIHFSAPKLSKLNTEKETISVSLAEALEIKADEKLFYVFTEHISGLEYLKPGRELHQKGLQWHLKGFEYRLFWNFREVYDHTGELEKLYWKLSGTGVESIDNALGEMRLHPVHEAFESLFSEDIINFLLKGILEKERSASEKLGYTLMRGRYENFITKLQHEQQIQHVDSHQASVAYIQKVKSIENLYNFVYLEEASIRTFLARHGYASLNEILSVGSKTSYRENTILLLAYFALDTLAKLGNNKEKSIKLIDYFKLSGPLQSILSKSGRGQSAVNRDMLLLNILIQNGSQFFDFAELLQVGAAEKDASEKYNVLIKEKSDIAIKMLESQEVNLFIGSHQYKKVWYFNKESYFELLDWLFTVSVLKYFTPENSNTLTLSDLQALVTESLKLLFYTRELADKTGFELKMLKHAIGKISLNVS